MASATNGLQLIGFSAQSTALAGSGHISVADTSAINTNPAALSLIDGSRVDVTAGFVQAFFNHTDAFGNHNHSGSNDIYALGNLGFATRISAIPGLIIGAGVFSQGGFGSGFQGLRTAFGGQDDTASFFRYMKASLALSYEVTENFSLGVSPSLGYADASLSLFPGTFVSPSTMLPEGFSGIHIHDKCSQSAGLGALGRCPSDVVFSVKLGMMYHVSPKLTIGAAYTSPVDFNFNGGEATLNFSGLGVGAAHYNNAKFRGVKWPQQVDVSLALKPLERITVSVTGSWINWRAFKRLGITAMETDNVFAEQKINLEMPFYWKDQWSIATGVSIVAIKEQAWKKKERLVLHFGYNYGSNPVSRSNMGPIAPLILEHHFTGGFGLRLTEKWSYSLGGLYAMKNSRTYTNSSLPFGVNAQESISGYYIYNTISYDF